MIEFNLDGTFVDAVVKYIGVTGLVISILLFFVYLLLPYITKYSLAKKEMKYKYKYKRQLVKLSKINTKIKVKEDESNFIISKKTLKIIVLMAILAFVLYLIYKYTKKNKSLIKENYGTN